MKEISPRLNSFDIVVTQEDFYYGKDLRSEAKHPYYSGRSREGLLGDGLSRFSIFPMSETAHVPWQECYGTLGHANDCLTPKGFSVAAHELAPGVFLDIYDLHMDAGNSPGDLAARTTEMDQLIEYISSHSAGRALIVAGDWNLGPKKEQNMALLAKILAAENLADSCRALSCGHERIDRVLFRGSDILKLKPVAYKVELELFANKMGLPLSDHDAVSVVFEWEHLGASGAATP
jgi:endonuclease/exonuclease/phosphatase (EEP) superfamily protein YafD